MEPTSRHMPLPEWDKKVAPILNAMQSRSKWLRVDANQIRAWAKELEAVPVFETQVMDCMVEARTSLEVALIAMKEAIETYYDKEKVT